MIFFCSTIMNCSNGQCFDAPSSITTKLECILFSDYFNTVFQRLFQYSISVSSDFPRRAGMEFYKKQPLLCARDNEKNGTCEIISPRAPDAIKESMHQSITCFRVFVTDVSSTCRVSYDFVFLQASSCYSTILTQHQRSHRINFL